MRRFARSFLVVALAVVPAALWAGVVSLPNTFSDGTVASAAQVNANFAAVKTAVDDNSARVGGFETQWTPVASCPTTGAANGKMCVTTAGRLYFHNGTRWRLVDTLPTGGGVLPTGIVAADVLNYVAFNGSVADTGTNGASTTQVGTVLYTTGKYDNAGAGFSTSNAVALTRVPFSTRTATGITLAAWVKGTNAQATPSNWQVANNIFGDADNAVVIGSGVASGKAAVRHSSIEYQSTKVVADDLWHHVAYVYTWSGTIWNVQIYVDGAADGGGALTATWNGAYAVNTIGRTYTAYTQYHGYQIDDAFVFGRALSAAQVNELWLNGQ